MDDVEVFMTVRIQLSERERFARYCKTIGRKPSDMLREMVAALCDERLTIEATQEMKTLKGIYK